MLRCLLLTSDDNTIRVVGRVFRDLDVEFEHYSDSSAALAHVIKNRYDAIVVDDCVDDAPSVLARVIELPSCNKAVRIVLADPAVPLHSIFKTGTQVILYKPLSTDRVRQGLRAVRNLMARDRRQGSKRVATTLPAKLASRQTWGGSKEITVSDLSDSGAAIQSGSFALSASGTLNLEFALPGNPQIIRATAEVVWQDCTGSAGVRFLDMPSNSRKLLTQWLKDQPSERKHNAFSSHAGR